MPKISRAQLRTTFLTAVAPTVGVGEAEAMFRLVTQQLWGLHRHDFIIEPQALIDADDQYDRVVDGLLRGEPVQYLLGIAEFCDLEFEVDPSVLIPRPETEELVHWVVNSASSATSILDIGTGSGAIAIAVAKMSECQVVAVDVSPKALAVAGRNGVRNGVSVDFQLMDILTQEPERLFDIIVSNPPYVPQSDLQTMARNVAEHEPHLALFVPDSDPLLFYRRIAQIGLRCLTATGQLLFEVYEHYADSCAQMLSELGYIDIEIRRDIHDKQRMIRCRRRPE